MAELLMSESLIFIAIQSGFPEALNLEVMKHIIS